MIINNNCLESLKGLTCTLKEEDKFGGLYCFLFKNEEGVDMTNIENLRHITFINYNNFINIQTNHYGNTYDTLEIITTEDNINEVIENKKIENKYSIKLEENVKLEIIEIGIDDTFVEEHNIVSFVITFKIFFKRNSLIVKYVPHDLDFLKSFLKPFSRENELPIKFQYPSLDLDII